MITVSQTRPIYCDVDGTPKDADFVHRNTLQTGDRLQGMWNRLVAVIEEQGQTLFRAAFQAIMRECGDISAEIFDTNGLMLAQAVTGTPGDIYMTNDPWLASGHLSDFLLLMPAFKNGRVIGYTSCTSHLVDLGGLGMGPKGSDFFDEGLLITRCKLVDQGETNALVAC